LGEAGNAAASLLVLVLRIAVLVLDRDGVANIFVGQRQLPDRDDPARPTNE
jgi:hypothetical protein